MPRYYAYLAGRRQQAPVDGSTFDTPSISDFLTHNAQIRDKATALAAVDVSAQLKPAAKPISSSRH